MVSLHGAEEFAPGFLKMERYNDIGGGTAVSDLTSAAKYPDSPDATTFIGGGFSTPVNIGNNFGARVSGFVIPDQDGSYRFYIRSDDASQLFISTDDNPANLGATPIAEETGCCGPFESPGAPETSAPISLNAGERYYVVGIYKEGGGGDFMEVGWALDGEANPSAPIPARFLGVMADPANASIEITQHPEDVEAVEKTTATFTIAANATPPDVRYQWQKDGTDISGATGTSYTTPVLSLGDDATYACVVSVAGLSVTSDEAQLTVVPDTTPPGIASVGSLMNPSGNWQVSVAFNELVDPVSAGDASNYSLSAGSISSVEFYENAGEHLPNNISQAAILTVSGLSAGSDYEVTVSGVKDASDNANEMSSTTVSFRATDLTWSNIGDHQADSTVKVVGNGGFDLISSGRAQWARYDETTLVYREVEGNWDYMAQVKDQDFSSQWARAGLMAREDLDLNATSEANDSDGRYMTAHANPINDTTGDSTKENRVIEEGGGNNGFESNARIEVGAETVGAGGGGPLSYPNVWVRLQRIDDTITAFWSKDNAQSWTQLAARSYDPPLAETLFVGPAFSPETVNIGEPFHDFLFLAQIRNLTELPLISSTPVNGAVFADASAGLSIRIESNAGVPEENVTITVQGTDRTGDFSASGTETDRTFTLQDIQPNVIYTVNVSVVDSEGTASSNTIRFDTFSQDNFTWEAEDFNFEEGEWIDDPILCDTVGSEPGCYFDKISVEGIDSHDVDDGGPGVVEDFYRWGSATAVAREEQVDTEPTGDFLRQKYVDSGIRDYNVGWVTVGEWLNYTRTYPAGEFNVYARLARDGDVVFENELSILSSPTAETQSQTPEKLGVFRREGTGGWQSYVWVPLTDDNGNLVRVNLDGVATLRSTATEGGYNANFYMLVPAQDVVETPEISVGLNTDGTIQLEWTGTLQSADNVRGPYSNVTGATSPMQVTPDQAQQYWRSQQP